jgi:hypothetical protein
MLNSFLNAFPDRLAGRSSADPSGYLLGIAAGRRLVIAQESGQPVQEATGLANAHGHASLVMLIFFSATALNLLANLQVFRPAKKKGKCGRQIIRKKRNILI